MWEDCTKKCVSRKHADHLFSAIIIHGNEFEERVVKLLPTCCNVASNKDSSGRTALQVAASFGRMKILDWLLSHGAHVHAKDEESGYSALHRALYFGQLQTSRILLNNNANLFQILDNDFLSPFDHLIKDRSNFKELDPSLPCEIYVWGTNSNYSLGLEKQQSPEFPELLDAFPKANGGLQQVVMNKFHSVFVTASGQAFSCGIGQGGKLGLGSEATVISPTKINLEADASLNNKLKKSKIIIQAAVGTYHTILLTDNGNVLSCGLNQHHQLGHAPPPMQVLIPKLVSSFEERNKGAMIAGVCASRFHSVFWCASSVYTCGLNAGALGHMKGEKTIIHPKRIPSLSEESQTITHVVASDGATAIATEKGNVYVLHEFQCRKIASKQLDLLKITMRGGMLDSIEEDLIVDNTSLQVVLLTKSGKIYIWSQTNPLLTRCTFRAGREFVMKDVVLCKNSMAFVSKDGEAFIGALSHAGTVVRKKGPNPSSSQQAISRMEFPKREQLVHINIQRVPGIYRATSVACDPEGKNFAVTHVHPSAPMEEIAKICPPPSHLKADLKQLLHDADPLDLTHDIVFHVGSRTFAAHRFILSANCSTFYQKVCAASSSFKYDDRTVNIPDVPPYVFEILLEFIYTGTCALFETEVAKWNVTAGQADLHLESGVKSTYRDLVDGTDKLENDDVSNGSRLICLVKLHAKNFGIRKLGEILEKVQIVNKGSLVRNDYLTYKPKSWNRFTGEDFYDIQILSDDGKEFSAHRAILTARSDYFRSMFSYVWIENAVSKTVPLPVHSLVLEVILDYIYEDKATKIEKSEDIDWIGNCLVVADLFLIPRLISICESVLVGLLTIKNVGKILEFSSTYNATELKNSCLYFICYNLPAVVELRIWDCLSEEVMKDLTRFYQNFNPRIAQRLPTANLSKDSDKHTFDFNDLSIIDSPADVTLSPLNREKEAKRKKSRRKSGKKGNDIKDTNDQQLMSPSSTIKPTVVPAATVQKEDGWLKVDKPKRRLKSLSFETTAKEVSSQSKSEMFDVLNIARHNKDEPRLHPNLVDESRGASLIDENVPFVKQNNLTLFEMATVIQTANSLESPKCKKFPKLSQKQRKLQETHSASVSPAVSSTVAWKSLNTSVDSQDANQQTANDCPNAIRSNLEDSSNIPPYSTVWRSPDKINKNINEAQFPVVEEKLVPLKQIIAKERIQRQNLIKISTKPLKCTLIEEKAIEDLKKFYGIENTDDEYIEVQRILPMVAAVPIWSKGKASHMSAKSRSLSMSDSGI